MFVDCKNLETLKFKHFNDLDKNTFCGSLFYGCNMLTKIEMDDFDKLNSFAEKENNQIFNYCNTLINMCKEKFGEKFKSINIVSTLEEKIKKEKQKMKEEEEKKIKEEEQKMKEEVEKDIKAYKEIRKQKEIKGEKINKKVVRLNSFTCKKIELPKEEKQNKNIAAESLVNNNWCKYRDGDLVLKVLEQLMKTILPLIWDMENMLYLK